MQSPLCQPVKSFLRRHRTAMLVTVIASTLTSCSVPPLKPGMHVCDRIPDGPSSHFWRATVKMLPGLHETAFHGEYGGSGNTGGAPLDEMDSICRQHDLIYESARSVRTLRIADRVFVELLRQLDESKLTPNGRAFRRNAIRFMSSKWALVIGKWPGSLLHASEPPGSPLASESQIRAFYSRRMKPGGKH